MKLLSLVLLTAGLALNAEAQIIPFEGIRTINGTKLYFRIFGKGEPLLAVHGGPGLNHTYFLPHLESLSKDFTVILYDERACGRSVIPDTDSLGLKFFVDDIDAIRKDLGLEKINILGHSWGAIPVVRYGIDYPEKVKSMVLCNAVALSHEFDSEIAAIQKKRNTPEDSIERANILNSPDFKSGQTKAYEKLMSLAFRHSFTSSNNSQEVLHAASMRSLKR